MPGNLGGYLFFLCKSFNLLQKELIYYKRENSLSLRDDKEPNLLFSRKISEYNQNTDLFHEIEILVNFVTEFTTITKT